MTDLSGIATTDPLSVTVQTITPELAEDWLKLNKVNRVIRPQRVKLYAKQMSEGQWKMTGEPIQRNGAALFNGQHRLLACITADTPFTTVVVQGVQPDAMMVMDSGLPRSVADALRFEGFVNTNQVATIARMVIGWRRGILRDRKRTSSEIPRAGIVAFSHDNNAMLQHAVNQGRRIRVSLGLSGAVWGAFYFLVAEVDVEAANLFTDNLVSGEGLRQGDAILALRSWTIQSVTGHRKRTNIEHLSVAVKAWNAWVTGTPIRLLKFLPTEEVPAVISL